MPRQRGKTTMKKIKFFALLLCLSMVLCACGGGNTETTAATTEASTEADYKVTVTDALGNPYTTGVIVSFVQNGAQVAMQPVDGSGVASKTLTRGDYTVELVFTGDESAYHVEEGDYTLTADKTELTVTLFNAVSGEGRTITADGKEYTAYDVVEGSTYVTLTAGERSYFLFTPTAAGTYEFSVSDDTAAIGYYGAPHFVQSTSAAEVVDNAFTISVSAGMIGTEGASGTSVIVIGVDGGSEAGASLSIERIGDAEWTVADEPWTVYQTTSELAPYTLPAGAKLQEFDLTAASYHLVLNETDGFYHLDSADGALVLVRLGEKNTYLDGYKTILEHTGVNKYFYDESGEFVKKENYADCLLEYIACIDENSGTYPLTEDLMYIIQNNGDYQGWWNVDGQNYLFVDENGNRVPGINTEIAWLFMCCYIAE